MRNSKFPAAMEKGSTQQSIEKGHIFNMQGQNPYLCRKVLMKFDIDGFLEKEIFIDILG